MNRFTGFLARPSFLEGIARVFDLGGHLQEYNYSRSGERADELALAMDMQAIAEDMRAAIETFAEENPEILDMKTLFPAVQRAF